MHFEQRINQQLAQKLLVYNDDLRQKKGDHYPERFAWIAIGSLWLYIGVQLIRLFIKAVHYAG
jgi:hypothetical protein